MLTRIKNKVRSILRTAVRQELDILRRDAFGTLASRDAAESQQQVSQRSLFNYWRDLAASGIVRSLSDVGFRAYSQFEEDGILLYLFAVLGTETNTFIDIGSADGINSNCANLAISFGWNGLFIDGNPENIARGRRFYSEHKSTWAYPPAFAQALVCRESINNVILGAGYSGTVDLVSIDIDGNDYWVWDALECVSPRVVIIETHIEFGLLNIVVPYDKDYQYPGRHEQYHGASPVAMAILAKRKGYRLVGANNYGFNTIYVRNDVGPQVVPEVSVESILKHPRNPERQKLFDEIKNWDYVSGE